MAEGASLLTRNTEKYREFESHTLRQLLRCTMVEDEYRLLKVQYEWLLDIVKRMEETVLMNPDRMNTNEKLDAVLYLIKQAKKVEREE